MDFIQDGSVTIATIRSDQGSEYLSKTFQSICMNNDIRQEFASVSTPEEIGIAERLNRTLLEKFRPMLLESNLPLTFWSFAVMKANFLYNRSPHSSLGEKTPFLLRYGMKESYERFIPFGCKVNRFIHKNQRGKLDDVTSPGIMVGYCENSTELKVLDFEKSEVLLAPSTSTSKANEFPGLPDETLTKFILNQGGFTTEDDEHNNDGLHNVILNENSDQEHIFLAKLPVYPRNISDAKMSPEAKK